ncbi:glucosamine-6-phosphate deaminase [Alicyclobacillus fastidiosus]|uniref:Glucosamine-6-phosphate deaminase n=1 Tax=Alicyclobacillus fastidiosus TaxID=392011 RepID=A0ABV5AJX8_9BACL|nr:glucosamine-6-phosphate deaminase [Alicyclobacillus fastidiosus]WEH09104.1 glucosamine-6-phosphate deaminase [Alicyclobacillus fastidiosus]
MRVQILPTANDLGRTAAQFASNVINKAIQEQGEARILLSTGASQFETLEHLIQQNIQWSKVTMFHLDEYVNLPDNHSASFIKYLRERFTNFVPLKEVHFVDGRGDIRCSIQQLTEEIRRAPIDLGLIGIGENTHLAFNDPPANFNTTDAYIVVQLDEACKRQQVREGWFETANDVPNEAITMTIHQIMQTKVIVSSVPHRVKAEAIRKTLENDVTNMIPSTMLKRHSNATIFLDSQSASSLSESLLRKYTME